MIAVFSAINFLEGTQNFFALFEILVENLLLNYSSCLKYNGQNETNVENTLNINKLADAHTGISKRKELLRKTNLFNEFEIKNLFITNMQVIFK